MRPYGGHEALPQYGMNGVHGYGLNSPAGSTYRLKVILRRNSLLMRNEKGYDTSYMIWGVDRDEAVEAQSTQR